LNVYDSRATGGAGGAVAAILSLRSGAVGASLRQRGDARRHRMEARQPFGAGGVQGHARRFSRGSRQALRVKPEQGVGCERLYLTPPSLVKAEELPAGWGLLELRRGRIEMVQVSAKNLRTATGFRYEMNLLLASLRRVEVRIEPQSITDFLKWKNRMAEYNRGALPEGLATAEEEMNVFLESDVTG